jgi:hypothetical protein
MRLTMWYTLYTIQPCGKELHEPDPRPATTCGRAKRGNTMQLENAYAAHEQALTADLAAYIAAELESQQGPVVSLRVGDIANVLDINAEDVLDKTRDLARRYWLEGQRFQATSEGFAYLLTVARLHGETSYVEVDIHRDDCHEALHAALLG